MAVDVVVTGLGMITPLGADAPSTIAAWRAGHCARRALVPELAGTSFAAEEVAVLPDPPVDLRFRNPRLLKFTSTAGVLGCVAAAAAAADAGIAGRFAPERIGLFAGAGLSSAALDEVQPMIARSLDERGAFSSRLLGSRGLSASHPLLAFKILPNMAPCLVSMMENIKGPSLVLTPWEDQTASALIEAWSAVAGGEVDCALAGAADDAANAATVVYLRHSGRLNQEEFVASAAAYVVFERAESAIQSARRIYCRVPRMMVSLSTAPGRDPLAGRMGRTFAAAPAVLFALGCVDPGTTVAMTGTDARASRAELEPAS
jgi:3-oxoacyl-(acyl-carrier-protein) synthase